jgi:elongation factor Ts
MSDIKLVQQLRAQTGAGVNDCKKAIDEAKGDINKAIEVLRKRGGLKADKKAERTTKEGIICSYIHTNNKAGAMLELACETDFVAKNKEFKELAHDLAMHIVAMNPLYIQPEDIPNSVIEKEKEIYQEQMENEGKKEEIIEKIVNGKIEKYYEDVCLLRQAFIKNEEITVEDLIKEKVAKIGENIKVVRFMRYQI